MLYLLRWRSLRFQLGPFRYWFLLPRITVYPLWSRTIPEIHSCTFRNEDMGLVPLVIFHLNGHRYAQGFIWLYWNIQKVRMPSWIHHTHCCNYWFHLLKYKATRTKVSAAYPSLRRRMFYDDYNLLLKSFPIFLLWLYERNGNRRWLSLGFRPNLGEEIFWIYQ